VKLVVGLGNPGKRYEGTRHNVGFEVIDELARRLGVAMAVEKFHGWFGKGVYKADDVVLLKPTTFMNRSGRSVLAAGRFYKLELPDLLVISDDVALPVGRLRIRRSGSAGGHNGLEDIVDALGSQDFSRLRVGVGGPTGPSAAYVLSPFEEAERPIVRKAVTRAADAVECWMERGVDAAMNDYNGDPPDAE